jgi:hypothetical protein
VIWSWRKITTWLHVLAISRQLGALDNTLAPIFKLKFVIFSLALSWHCTLFVQLVIWLNLVIWCAKPEKGSFMHWRLMYIFVVIIWIELSIYTYSGNLIYENFLFLCYFHWLATNKNSNMYSIVQPRMNRIWEKTYVVCYV